MRERTWKEKGDVYASFSLQLHTR